MPKLSVITINLNNSAGLEKTLISIFSQTFKDYELIVMDGGSNDGSTDVLKKHVDNITFWVSEKDQGIFNAHNKGLQKAHGDYCLFLNSGDCLQRPEVLMKIFSEKPFEDILYGDMITVDATGEKKKLKMPSRIGHKRMLADTVWHPCSFIKRELFVKHGGYNESFKIVADYEFFVRMIIKEKVSMRYLPFPISIFDRTGVSSAVSNKKQLIEERNRAQDMYFNPFLLRLFRAYSKLRN